MASPWHMEPRLRLLKTPPPTRGNREVDDLHGRRFFLGKVASIRLEKGRSREMILLFFHSELGPIPPNSAESWAIGLNHSVQYRYVGIRTISMRWDIGGQSPKSALGKLPMLFDWLFDSGPVSGISGFVRIKYLRYRRRQNVWIVCGWRVACVRSKWDYGRSFDAAGICRLRFSLGSEFDAAWKLQGTFGGRKINLRQKPCRVDGSDASTFRDCGVSIKNPSPTVGKHHDFTTWKGCVEYVKDMRDMWKKTHQCAKDVREIETSTLLTIKAENQRKSGENIRDCDEICDALGSQSAARAGHRKYTVSYEALASV
ncbi:hypothetical protein DFH08DRAFT_1051542 [Mycena albidolilacea]|uniref:Uncharacterized protein n=1 Tax=Mycena albidolilacea TaxID=1033008 RepID=A0AAD7EBB3_9AGAR|nr:hypothetical protein DFH08DRAFT_1051542 [Mycena albidolilacea]